MIRRIAIIVCVVSISLLCGCSGTSTINSESDASKPAESVTGASTTTVISLDKDTKEINYDTVENIIINTAPRGTECFQLNKAGYFYWSGDSQTMSISGNFSTEKIKEVFNLVLSCELTEFNPNHPNEDGVMIWDYPNHYITLNSAEIDGTHTYTVSEEDFSKIYSAVKAMSDAMWKAQREQFSQAETENSDVISIPALP